MGYYILAFVIGAIFGIVLAMLTGHNFAYNSGYSHGREDTENLYADLRKIDEDAEAETERLINGKYKVREEEDDV